jgi:hypothetical protein
MFGGAQTFNNLNLLSGNSFNRIFADTPTPSDPIIDLSSGCETEEFDSQNNQANRKRHHSAEVLNIAKRKAHENLMTESQKNRNRNVPLKKRGTGNREEELSFLNLLANSNSNQPQNLVKTEYANDTPLSENSANAHPKNFLNIVKDDNVCDCFSCFPVLGAKGSTKCKKLTVNDGAGTSSSTLEASMMPGPSGIQQKKPIIVPAKKRNYYESDSDDSDDQIEIPDVNPVPIVIDDGALEVKNGVLAAPDLQLDWLTDSSPEEDDDVIFVSDRTAPIDLTADSDTDNAPSPTDAVSIDRNPSENVTDCSNRTTMSYQGVQRYTEPFYHLPIPSPPVQRVIGPTLVNTSRAPIMSSVASSSVPIQNAITISSPQLGFIETPAPRLHTPPPPRQTNFRNMITGNDVMLYDGQNYVPRFTRDSSSNPPIPEVSENDNASHASSLPRPRIQNQSPVQQERSNRRHFNLPSVTSYYRPPSPVHRVPQPIPVENPGNPPTAHQNCRQHVGRCPFMTEGHHYNRPRRFSRDFYTMSNGRPPYAVHEDLWRRQYQEQEIRRQFWSPSFNESVPEVQDLRPPPATPYVGNEPINHRLVSSLNENANAIHNNNVSNSIDLSRLDNRFDRMPNITRSMHQNLHNRHRRAVPW